MNRHITLGLTLVAGIGIGAAAVQTLHAQAKPPVYYVTEVELTNPEAYFKEYAPRQGDLIRQMGGRYVVAGGKTTTFEGDPPKSRVGHSVMGESRQNPGMAFFRRVQGFAPDWR